MSFVNPSVRMFRAVRLIKDTHPNCENVECELCEDVGGSESG